MTVFDDNSTPELRLNVDFSTLAAQPTPEEFFVLSRVNGQLTIAQLCGVTGLGREKTLLALEKLRDVGLLKLSDTTDDSSPDISAATEQNSTEPAQPPRTKEPNYTFLPISLDGFAFDEEILAQQVEIDEAIKREILYVFAQLNDIDHYQLLGVDRKASRKEIRNGYFALTRRFHPDLFFRRLLGDYEVRIEKLFQRTVKAYETLSHPKKRAAYDETLAQSASSTPTSSLTSETPSQPEYGETAQVEKKRDMAFTILVNRADGHASQGDWNRACEEYKNALRIKRDLDLALRVARTLLDARTENEQAFVFASAALKMEQDCIDALLILGELYQVIGAHDDALAHYRRAQEIAPSRLDIQQLIEQLNC